MSEQGAAHWALLTGNEEEADTLIRQGWKSPYGLASNDVHIPSSTITGRLPGIAALPKSFTAYINKSTGVLRIDNLDHPEFWMEIQLGNILK